MDYNLSKTEFMPNSERRLKCSVKLLTWDTNRCLSFSTPRYGDGPACRCFELTVACVADSCKHPCTQSAQRFQFACSSFHENKKLFLIGYFGLVWYAPFDRPKIMITPQSRAYNKNKCNLISRSDGGTDLLTWCLNIHVDYSFAIRYLIRSMLGSPWEDHW